MVTFQKAQVLSIGEPRATECNSARQPQVSFISKSEPYMHMHMHMWGKKNLLKSHKSKKSTKKHTRRHATNPGNLPGPCPIAPRDEISRAEELLTGGQGPRATGGESWAMGA